MRGEPQTTDTHHEPADDLDGGRMARGPAWRPRREHDLKCWPEFFDAALTGDKPFELRRDDRGFREGDTLLIREWEPETKDHTGRECRKRVTYALRDASGFGLEEGFVIMGLRDVQ